MKTLLFSFLLISASVTAQKQTDTIPVKLLVSKWQGTFSTEGMFYEVFGLDGFSVFKWSKKIVDRDHDCMTVPCLHPYAERYEEEGLIHSHYIGSNKKPLPKNIIIWLVK